MAKAELVADSGADINCTVSDHVVYHRSGNPVHPLRMSTDKPPPAWPQQGHAGGSLL